MKSLAAVYYGNRTIRVEEIPVPEIKSDEILVQVKACGVCGTDVHIFSGAKGAADCVPPKVLGHEFSGIVAKTGSSCKDIREGDRVVIDPNDMCGRCIFCRSGKGHFCENMIGIGTTVNGGFEEYCAVREKQAVKISKDLSFDEASFSEPVSCCLHGIDLAKIKAGSTVLIIGAGPIGMIMLQLARISGAAKLIVIEPVESKRKLAKKLGASVTADPSSEDVGSVLRNKGIYHIDTVIECVGAKQTMQNAVSYAGKGATVVFFGLTSPECTVEIKPFEIFQKELTITSSYINPYTIARAVSLLESGIISVKPLIAGTMHLEDLGRVLGDNSLRRDGKIIIHP
jgi:threonine dehydrogenase-like Zn-dependent dehydrogenase